MPVRFRSAGWLQSIIAPVVLTSVLTVMLRGCAG